MFPLVLLLWNVRRRGSSPDSKFSPFAGHSVQWFNTGCLRRRTKGCPDPPGKPAPRR
jgi:hypothetical protein